MIMRHWDTTYDEAKIRALPRFDAFVFQIGHGHEQIAAEYAETRRAISYFNVWTKPPAAWPDPLPPYLALVRAICPPLMEPPDPMGTRPPGPVKAWGEGRELIDWSLMDNRKQIDLGRMVRSQAALTPNLWGVFHDLAFRRPVDWMLVPSSLYWQYPAEKWVHAERRFLRFQEIAYPRDRTISNGDPTLPGPRYYEYAERSWDAFLDAWKSGHPDSVLSVNAADEGSVDKLITVHMLNPDRWIAFSGRDEAAIDLAYEQMAQD